MKADGFFFVMNDFEGEWNDGFVLWRGLSLQLP